MHLVYLCNEYPPFAHGGIGVKYQRIARQLVKEGWQVSVVGVYRVDDYFQEHDQGVVVHRLPAIVKRGPVSLINALRINRCLQQIHKESPIDLIESQEAGLAFLPRLFPAKKIIRMSGGHNFFAATLGTKSRFWRNLMERLSFSRADAICAVSSFVANTTRELLNLNDSKITVLPNPVDTDLFKPLAGIQEEQGMILFVGTVTEKKGIRQLIEAMPAIQKAVPAAHLYIVGRDSFDKQTGKSYTDYLKKNMAQDIFGSIQFVGPVPNKEVNDWVARAEVCVYPSHMEAQGIVVIEAMAAGKAVVASKLGPGPELINHGIDGLLCDPYNPVDIADKVTSLLTDPVLRQNLSLMARKKVEANFSIGVLIAKNLSFYDTVLGK